MGRAPLPGDDVVFDTSATVTMDVPAPEVHDLTVQGGAQVTLNFDANNHFLKADNNIYLDLTNGNQSSLTFASNSPTQEAGIHAENFIVEGAFAGSGQLIVQAHTRLDLAQDLNAKHYQFDLTAAGTVDGVNAFLTGKDTDLGTVSNISVTGAVALTGDLRIGGDGRASYQLNSGSTKVAQFGVYNGSYLDVQGFGAGDQGLFQFSGDGVVGEPAAGAPFAPNALLSGQTGANVLIHNRGRLSR
jgi:hypothetical protein